MNIPNFASRHQAMRAHGRAAMQCFVEREQHLEAEVERPMSQPHRRGALSRSHVATHLSGANSFLPSRCAASNGDRFSAGSRVIGPLWGCLHHIAVLIQPVVSQSFGNLKVLIRFRGASKVVVGLG